MPDEFADALDRLDINFEDAFNREFLIERLSVVLGRDVTTDQLRIAQAKFQQQAQRAILLGFSVTRFQRGVHAVVALRDSRGRFMTETTFRLDDQNKTIVVGAGRIDAVLRQRTAS